MTTPSMSTSKTHMKPSCNPKRHCSKTLALVTCYLINSYPGVCAFSLLSPYRSTPQLSYMNEPFSQTSIATQVCKQDSALFYRLHPSSKEDDDVVSIRSHHQDQTLLVPDLQIINHSLPEGTQDPRNSFIYHFYQLLNTLDTKKESQTETNLAFTGNYAPVAEEHYAVPLEVVSGAIPADLDGLYFRNGPNPIPGHTSKPSHWFDGHGMLHCVRIKESRATYSNTYIPTPRYLIEKEAQEDVFVRMGEFRDGIIGLIKALLIEKELGKAAGLRPFELFSANNNAVMFQNRFFCLHEAGFPFEVKLNNDGAIIAGLSYETFDNGLTTSVSGHSAVDPVNGNFLIHSYMHDGPLSTAEVSAYTGEIEQKRGGPRPDGGLIPSHVSLSHELAFSQKWRIIFDTPLRLDPSNLLSGGGILNWHDDHTLKIGLIPRLANQSEVSSEDDIHWIETGFKDVFFHTMNAWDEEDGSVVFWALASNRFEPVFDGQIDSGSNLPFQMVEYRLHPETDSVQRILIDDQLNLESPKCHPDTAGQFNRYGFAGLVADDPSLEGTFTGFTIWDLKEKRHISTINYEQSEVSSEPVIIPKAGRKGSREVYIGIYIHNLDEDQSYFLLYDGEVDSSEPITRLRLPSRVPYGFHGSWITGIDLEKHIRM